MKNMKMFCLTLEPKHYQFIKDLNYIPVGLGDKTFDNNWLSDKSGINISKKNKYYGEYTFHYWIWKNYLDKLDNDWVGFCQYRKFWCLKEYKNEDINFTNLRDKVLKQIPKDFDRYDSIVGKPMYVNQLKVMKFFKKGLKVILKKPSLLFREKKRNLSFHFDLMHGENNLNKAINLLDTANKDDFRKFVNTEVSFNPHNMFICKSKSKLEDYYNVLFPWLEKCENLFGFENLKGYDQTRIYGFLAERFMSYWFNKYTQCTTMPIIFYDIRENINK